MNSCLYLHEIRQGLALKERKKYRERCTKLHVGQQKVGDRIIFHDLIFSARFLVHFKVGQRTHHVAVVALVNLDLRRKTSMLYQYRSECKPQNGKLQTELKLKLWNKVLCASFWWGCRGLFSFQWNCHQNDSITLKKLLTWNLLS
jgi:hypothetical protein